MALLRPGDVATVVFIGAASAKRRPVVVLSSEAYLRAHPDAVVGILTSNIAAATTDFDYALQDWAAAGLKRPSAFRTYLQTDLQSELVRIGRLTDRDWAEVRARLAKALG